MKILELKSADDIKEKIQQYFRKNEEAKFIHRLHGILLKIENKDNTCETIAKLFGQSSRAISNWINKVNEAGDIEVLRDKIKPGRNTKLNDVQRLEIKNALQKPPELRGISANIWDGKSL